ncbi:hypothetical protein [Dictyobacter kobayashii]|uniref:Uncharacterized protein n=1 Tax=Dictyobacter kobayashii TaxID=2014872 RepID=A0A402AFT3_9CHLR|nr:hypothetical protein [Dictyobacter kobayashii]GCE17946.1 hypothetical protein KDK_17460 [Dictyobacter kobayashii]
MCRRSFESSDSLNEGGPVPPSLSFLSVFDALIDKVKVVGYGVDTLIVNIRYSDDSYQPLQKELDDHLQN